MLCKRFYHSLLIYSAVYVAYGGGEHPHTDYEVLCGCNPHWVPTEGNNLPPNAVPSGETADGKAITYFLIGGNKF